MNDSEPPSQPQQFLDKLRLVVDNTSSKVGHDYFKSLAQSLSSALGADYVFIGEALEEFKRVRTLAYWSENRFVSNVEYETRETPCGRILNAKITFFPDKLRELFPDDPDLDRLEAESYLAIPFFDQNGQASGHVCVMSKRPMEKDVYNEYLLEIISARLSAEYERNRSEQRLAHMANHDPLTDLPNRILFWDRLNTAIRRSERHNSKFGIIFIDLDNFKPLNDRYGHHLGDEYLKSIAHRMRTFCRGADTVCRYGGDEFTVIVENAHDVNDIACIANGLHDALTSDSYSIDGQQIDASVSIGFSVYPEHATMAEELLKKADLAMYLAKHKGSCVEMAQ